MIDNIRTACVPDKTGQILSFDVDYILDGLIDYAYNHVRNDYAGFTRSTCAKMRAK